jgi:hypothetical protein
MSMEEASVEVRVGALSLHKKPGCNTLTRIGLF